MYGSIMTIFSLLSCITSLLGCWQLGETSTYQIDANGEQKLIYRNLANVAPTICFQCNNEGGIEYADGEIVLFDWHMLSDSSVFVVLHKDSTETHSFNMDVLNEKVILSEYKTDKVINKHILYLWRKGL